MSTFGCRDQACQSLRHWRSGNRVDPAAMDKTLHSAQCQYGNPRHSVDSQQCGATIHKDPQTVEELTSSPHPPITSPNSNTLRSLRALDSPYEGWVTVDIHRLSRQFQQSLIDKLLRNQLTLRSRRPHRTSFHLARSRPPITDTACSQTKDGMGNPNRAPSFPSERVLPRLRPCSPE